jgi:hypothetical protein
VPFDTFTQRLKDVATNSLAYCRRQFGSNGLLIEAAIGPGISWRPTFAIRPTSSLILAVEVADNLYPEALKGAAHDISHFDFPIAVYQACSLEVYQSDPGQARINLLRQHGFGVLTVDHAGIVTTQHAAIPLAQHISKGLLDAECAGLNPAIRVKFNAAHLTYQVNEGQGLQQAGQIVEGLVVCIAKQAAKEGVITPGVASGGLADAIDALYATKKFAQQRAALGAARDFIKDYRNTASHAPRSAKQAAEKIRRCRAGFLDGIRVAKKLRETIQIHGYRTKVYTT